MTDDEMNAMTRFAAPLGALAVAAAVAFGAIAAVAQTPAPVSPPGSDTKDPATQNQPSTRDPAASGSPASPPAAKPNAGAPNGAQKSSELVGREVVDKAGQVVGSISKVDTLPSGEIRNVEISTGGFLGFGAKTMRVPGDKIERTGQQLVLNLPPEQIKTMMQ